MGATHTGPRLALAATRKGCGGFPPVVRGNRESGEVRPSRDLDNGDKLQGEQNRLAMPVTALPPSESESVEFLSPPLPARCKLRGGLNERISMWIIGKYRADGSINFADRPAKHKTRGDAVIECERLANENKGVTFAMFQLVIERQVVDVERDEFGREIVRRNDDIILVKVGNGYTVCKENGRLWYCDNIWMPEVGPHNCAYATIEDGIAMFNKAVRDAVEVPKPETIDDLRAIIDGLAARLARLEGK